MKLSPLSLCLLLFLIPLLSFGQSEQKGPGKLAEFRIVGYYSLRAAMQVNTDTVPFDQLTHINLAFLNPDTTGNFGQDLSLLAPFIQAAHQKEVKVLASIAGGGDHSYYHRLLEEDKRGKLIRDLVSITKSCQLDGIDVDLEGSDMGVNYEKFVVELGEALREEGKMMTAAIAVFYKDQLSDKVLQEYDFVNIMSYDHTGPWRPEKPGPHSPFEEAVEALRYFGEERGIPKENMVLGVPFYGYGFGETTDMPVVSQNYRQIVAAYPGAEELDEWKMPDGRIIYYNGIPTIKEKTRLAREKASGIMIWQILGDTKGPHSLLKAINEEVEP